MPIILFLWIKFDLGTSKLQVRPLPSLNLNFLMLLISLWLNLENPRIDLHAS